ncbi:MAG: PDZ domain-containing protein [Planctomycetes bacterium]|nr:PDZ domain-containing protein [Planctomycetota bacterium]
MTRAVSALLLALALAPTALRAQVDDPAWEAYARATANLHQKRYAAALDDYRQALDLDAHGPLADDARYWAAYCMEQSGQRTEALAAFEEALEVDPGSAWAEEARAAVVRVRMLDALAAQAPLAEMQATRLRWATGLATAHVLGTNAAGNATFLGGSGGYTVTGSTSTPLFAGGGTLSLWGTGTEAPRARPERDTVELEGGDTLSGRLVEGGGEGVLLLEVPGLAEPARVDLEGLRRLDWAPHAGAASGEAPHRVDLVDGSHLRCKVLGLDADGLRVELPWGAALAIPRPWLRAVRFTGEPLDCMPERDPVCFANGDRLSGECLSMTAETLVLGTAFGEVAVPRALLKHWVIPENEARAPEGMRLELEGEAGAIWGRVQGLGPDGLGLSVPWRDSPLEVPAGLCASASPAEASAEVTMTVVHNGLTVTGNGAVTFSYPGVSVGEWRLVDLAPVQIPPAAPAPPHPGRVDRLELAGGDRLSGRLTDLADGVFVLEADFGPVAVPRTQVEGIDLAPSERAYLGVRGGQEARGFQVDEVLPDTAAQAAGLAAGDLIVEVAGVAVTAERPLQAVLAGLEPGSEQVVTVDRQGTRLDIALTLGDR